MNGPLPARGVAPWLERWAQPSPWRRSDAAWLAGLLLATLWSRVRSASSSLYTVDSVLFAVATEEYDVTALQPHPPGYPVFVALGRLVRALSGADANSAFVAIAIGFSLVAVACLYGVLRAWGTQRAAVCGTALFAAAPAFVFNGAIALSYTAEAAASVGVALLAWRAWQAPTPARLAALGVAWGLAVGIRQSLFMFLGPLVAAALWDAGLRWPGAREWTRRALWLGGASLATALAWFVPMVQATGGYAAWKRATDLQSSHVVFADAVWVRGLDALREHADRLAYFLHWEAALLLPLAGVALALVALLRRRAPITIAPPGAGALSVIWVAPALAFYLLVFDGWERGPIGYVLTVLPALYVAAALVADAALRALAQAQLPRVRPAVAAIAVPLLLLPLPGLATAAHGLLEAEVEAHDAWAEAWQLLEAEFPANDSAILVWHSWAHVKWSFPEHVAWTYFPSYKVTGKTDWALVFAMRHHRDEAPFIDAYVAGPGQPEHPVPAHVRRVVVFDFQLAGENGAERRLRDDVAVQEHVMANGWRVLWFEPDLAQPTVESWFTDEALGRAVTPA